jgi:Rad3-related DNA helicase
MYTLASTQTPALYLKCQIAYSGSDIKLNLFCLDPKMGFHRITAMKPRCIILTSGTLNPINSIPLELETEFSKPLACSSLVRQEQVSGCILTRGPNKVRFNFSYENRDNAALYKDLGLTLM